MFKIFKARILVWPLILVLALLLAGAVFLVIKAPTFASSFGAQTEENNTQVITSITRTEEVSILSLGIQGIKDKSDNKTFFGVVVPGSERAMFLKYEFKAKLGFDASDVKISPTGENAYRITIPAFIFIGHDDPKFTLVADNSGGLSLLTPEIDQLDMVNEILNDDAQLKYIADYDETLREQATSFYTGIVQAIDSDVALEFVFADPGATGNE